MGTRIIDLLGYRGGMKSTLYTGRPQGKEVRKKIGLDEEDVSQENVVFVIPKDTTSFNPSFYLGLLFDSISKLGKSDFEKKYSFDYSKVNEEYRDIIESDLQEGMRYAMNSLNNDTGFDSFL